MFSYMTYSRCRGGLYSLYSIAHAQFVWDLKTEPAYIKLFEEIWGTDELLGESFRARASARMSGAELILDSCPFHVVPRFYLIIPADSTETSSSHETVSFDGAYLGVPLPKEEVEDENAPWPHTDQ